MSRKIGPLTINPYLREVTLNGERVEFTMIEYDLLLVLASEPRRVFTREELYRHVWGLNTPPSSRTLDQHAVRLRQKLSANGDRYIINVWGVGYRLADLDFEYVIEGAAA